MKISVITASYNQGGFIKKCLDSIRKQGKEAVIEHIILDNCSTDNTAQELAAYQASPGAIDVKIIVEADEGQTAAINKGFLMATGEILSWLNTDEWYEAGALAKVTDFFAEHPEVDIVFGDCDFVDSVGNLVKHKREYFYSESMLIYYGCFIPSCATFVRRRVIDDGIMLNPEFKVTMDFDWYVRMAKAGYCFSHFPATLASFTWHETNISSTLVKRRKLERRLVQDRYGGISGPNWFRTFVYGIMLRFWQVIRVTRRFAH